jgi:RNase adaptor protein for sRNA GlmZ degradation
VSRGPKSGIRTADLSARAIAFGKITPPAIEDVQPISASDGKDPAAVALGRKGGKARAAAISAKRRKEIARKAAKSRWRQ